MFPPQTTSARKAAAGFGLLVVLAWLALPSFHRLVETGSQAGHAHDESRCPTCQTLLHTAVDTPAASLWVAQILPASDVQTASCQPLLIRAPDLRAHPSQGPPSA